MIKYSGIKFESFDSLSKKYKKKPLFKKPIAFLSVVYKTLKEEIYSHGNPPVLLRSLYPCCILEQLSSDIYNVTTISRLLGPI